MQLSAFFLLYRNQNELGGEIDDNIVCHTDTLVVNVNVYQSLVLG